MSVSQIDTENFFRWKLGGGVAECDELAKSLSVRGELVHLEKRSAKLPSYLGGEAYD